MLRLKWLQYLFGRNDLTRTDAKTDPFTVAFFSFLVTWGQKQAEIEILQMSRSFSVMLSNDCTFFA